MALVLVSRALEDAKATAERLAKRGHQSLISPVIDIRPTGTCLPDSRFDHVIVASAHALTALSVDDLAKLRHLPLFAVGIASGEAARRAGFLKVASAGGDRHGLIDLLQAELPPASRLLFLAGEDRHFDLEETLRNLGHTVEICVTYRAEARRDLTKEAKEALGSGRIAAVLHYSPRSARLLLEAVERAALLDAFSVCLHACLSSDVAKALPANFRTAIAKSPSQNDLFAALDLALGHDSVAIAGKTDLPAITKRADKVMQKSPLDGD